jgi:uncharacterized protein (TIGR03118 family)
MVQWVRSRQRLLGRRDAARRRRDYPLLWVECLSDRCVLSGAFTQVNLASDLPGVARVTDANLVNPWGISFSPTGPFWFADNGTGLSNVLDGRGERFSLVVTTTGANGTGKPTGTVFNGGPGFRISENGISGPSRFLFAGADGTISGWTAVVDQNHAVLAVDNSSAGARYTGLTIATDPAGRSFLYAADFGRARVDVFDQAFQPVPAAGSFYDPDLPRDFAPFNIESIDNLLVVMYAQQDELGEDEVAGVGLGFIDIFDTGGNLLRRFASHGALNAPWGLARAPANFGSFGGALLVGNAGDGHINAYDPMSGEFLGTLEHDNGAPITVPSLWALTFGNGHMAGDSDTLFFTAGIDDEEHGLFGAIQSPERSGADTAGLGTFDLHAPGEPGDYPLPPRGGPAIRDRGSNSHGATVVLMPLKQSSPVIAPTLSGTDQPTMRPEPSGRAVVIVNRSPDRLDTISAPRLQTLVWSGTGTQSLRRNAAGPSPANIVRHDLQAERSHHQSTHHLAMNVFDSNGAKTDGPSAEQKAQARLSEAANVADLVTTEDFPDLVDDDKDRNEGVESRGLVGGTQFLCGIVVVVGIRSVWALCHTCSGRMFRSRTKAGDRSWQADSVWPQGVLPQA